MKNRSNSAFQLFVQSTEHTFLDDNGVTEKCKLRREGLEDSTKRVIMSRRQFFRFVSLISGIMVLIIEGNVFGFHHLV